MFFFMNFFVVVENLIHEEVMTTYDQIVTLLKTQIIM